MRFSKILLLFLIYIGFTSISHAQLEVNGIAAIANGKPITKREVAFMLAPSQAQLMARYPRRGAKFNQEMTKAKDRVLDELIDRELILHEFKNKLGGSLPDTAIKDDIKRQIREVYNGKEEEFLKQLKQLRMSRTKYEELTRKKLIVQAMRAQQFNDAAPPTPGEVREEYNKVKRDFRDVTKDKITYEKIYLRKESEDGISFAEDQLKLAEDLVEQLRNGASFSELAKEHSTDAYASDGGKWPLTDRTDLSPEFASIIFSEPKDTIIGPLEDKFGFTIVRVLSTIDGPSPSLKEVRKNIEARIRRQKNSTRYERWISQIRSRSIIKKKM